MSREWYRNRSPLRASVSMVTAAVLVVFACVSHNTYAAEDPQNHRFVTTSDETFALADLHGSVVVLHFFASWCGECMVEAPSLNALARALASSRNVSIVGVSIDDAPIAAKAFVQRMKIPYRVLVDEDQILKRRFSVRGVPMTVVLDSSGHEVAIEDPASGKKTKRFVGPRDWTDPTIIEQLQLLAREEEAPEVARTGLRSRMAR